MLQQSLSQHGAGRSILVDQELQVIAGNKTLEQAIKAGITKVLLVKSDGKILIAAMREDVTLDSEQGREMAILDNLSSELGLDWDADNLIDSGVDLSTFFTDDEMNTLTVSFDPINLEDTERLDQRSPVTCPKCQHEFIP